MRLTIETKCPQCNIPEAATSIIEFLGKDMKLQLEEIAMLSFYCSNCGNYIAVNEIETHIEEE